MKLSSPQAQDTGGLVTLPVSAFAVMAGGEVSLDGGVAIGGNVGAVSHLWLAAESRVRGAALSCADVMTGRQVAITGDILAGGKIWLDQLNEIGGSVQAVGAIGLGRRTTVEGDVITEQTFDIRALCEIAGGIRSVRAGQLAADARISGDVKIAAASVDRWTPQLLVATPMRCDDHASCWKPEASITHLEPGVYGSIDLGRNCVLRLRAGVYQFRRLWLANNVRVIADTTDGDVVIHLADGMTADSGVSFARSGEGAMSLLSRGYVYLGAGGVFDANIMSFEGDMDVDQNCQITGRLYARGDLWLGHNAFLDGGGRGVAPVAELIDDAISPSVSVDTGAGRHWETLRDVA